MAAPLPSAKVLVTGASGFIGLHTTLHLLQLGYGVRATVRTDAHEKSVRATLSKHIDTTRLEFACTDLLKDAGWQDAVHGCDSVIHTASPFIAQNPKDEDELIRPALDGTLRVVRAAQAEGIHRLVMLSTVGAIFDGHEGENRTFDETVWSNLERPRLVYHKSKTLAERAAWDFIHSPENKSKMEMVAINPSNVFGPVLDDHHCTSMDWYLTIMRAEVPGMPHLQMDIVDVRDLVDILAKAMGVPAAADKRFICNAVSIPVLEFTDILHRNFSKRGYRIPNRTIPDLVARLIGIIDPNVKPVARAIGWKYQFSTAQIQSVFGWQPRPYEQTIVDMAESLIEFGIV